MVLSLFRKDPRRESALALYETIIAQSRDTAFYALNGAPDTPEGRFELLTLHVYLALRRLKGSGADADKLSQALFDVFFRNMDDSLREMGVGDLSVGKKIRKMAEAFYGRVGAYEEGLRPESAISALANALARNVFEKSAGDDAPGALAIAGYMREADQFIAAQPLDDILAGRLNFPPAPEGAH